MLKLHEPQLQLHELYEPQLELHELYEPQLQLHELWLACAAQANVRLSCMCYSISRMSHSELHESSYSLSCTSYIAWAARAIG